MIVENRSYKYTMGDDMLSPSFLYIFCLLPSSHVLPLIVQFLFFFIRLTASSDFLLYF